MRGVAASTSLRDVWISSETWKVRTLTTGSTEGPAGMGREDGCGQVMRSHGDHAQRVPQARAAESRCAMSRFSPATPSIRAIMGPRKLPVDALKEMSQHKWFRVTPALTMY